MYQQVVHLCLLVHSLYAYIEIIKQNPPTGYLGLKFKINPTRAPSLLSDELGQWKLEAAIIHGDKFYSTLSLEKRRTMQNKEETLIFSFSHDRKNQQKDHWRGGKK